MSVPLADLDADREWVVSGIEIEGSEHYSERKLKTELRTRPRPWYQPWKARPQFDPAQFEGDLKRLRRLYEREGFFSTRIDAGVRVRDEEDARLDLEIRIEEGGRASVTSVEVLVDGQEQDSEFKAALPLRAGKPFSEERYQQTEAQLLRGQLDRGHAHAGITRRAEVSPDRRSAAVRYALEIGPPTVFGATQIKGLEDVESRLVERELRYTPGAPFSLKELEQTRSSLLALKLFSNVRIDWDREGASSEEIPVAIQVVEAPPREIRVGAGYSTTTEFGARIAWRHYNWLGGGQHLTVSGKYSTIISAAELDFLQPHLFGRESQGLLSFRLFQDDEDTYTLNSIRIVPRLQWQATPAISIWTSYRAQFAKLLGVGQPVEDLLGGVRREGVLSGPSAGLAWNGGLEGTRFRLGTRYLLEASQIGAIWGGDFHFYTLATELAHSLDLGFGFELSGRVRLSFVDALGQDQNLPLFERLFAGGQGSVRGFGRRQLGPKVESGDPIGGLSRFESSIELRRQVWGSFGAAAFFDVGQVSLDRFDFSRHEFETSAGPGLTYDTAVGPLSLYVGFPLDPPDEQRWEIHFSVGYFF